MIGLIVMIAERAELLQMNVVPPLAVSEVFTPSQIATDGGDTDAMGSGLTVTVPIAEAVQEFASVTVTV